MMIYYLLFFYYKSILLPLPVHGTCLDPILTS